MYCRLSMRVACVWLWVMFETGYHMTFMSFDCIKMFSKNVLLSYYHEWFRLNCYNNHINSERYSCHCWQYYLRKIEKLCPLKFNGNSWRWNDLPNIFMEVMSTCLFPWEVKCISKNISSITIFVDIYFCLMTSNELGQLIQSCNLGLRIWQKTNSTTLAKLLIEHIHKNLKHAAVSRQYVIKYWNFNFLS